MGIAASLAVPKTPVFSDGSSMSASPRNGRKDHDLGLVEDIQSEVNKSSDSSVESDRPKLNSV